jgi:xanthine dehydrogenase YagS FAD-binding subunit
VELPQEGFSKNWCYLKIRDRASYAFALVSVAACLEMQGDRIKTARLALGGVGTVPWAALDAEKMLSGANASEDNFKKAAELVMKDAHGYGHNDFKIELGKRVVAKALKLAASGAVT